MLTQAQPAWQVSQQTWPLNHSCGKIGPVLESVIVITSLTLSVVSQPYYLWTSLWAAGAAPGWNSDLHERVYFYAKDETPTPVPFIGVRSRVTLLIGIGRNAQLQHTLTE